MIKIISIKNRNREISTASNDSSSLTETYEKAQYDYMLCKMYSGKKELGISFVIYIFWLNRK